METPVEIVRIVQDLRKRIRPARCVLQLADGREEPISLQGKRRIWERVGKILAERDWTRLDSWNAAGEALEPILPPDEEETERRDDDHDPLSRGIDTVMRAVDRMAQHLRYGSKETIDQLLRAIDTLTTRNAELELYVSQAHEWVHQAAETIHAPQQQQLAPKDLAFLQVLDKAGQKILGLPPLQLPAYYQAPAAGGNGASATATGPKPGETEGAV